MYTINEPQAVKDVRHLLNLVDIARLDNEGLRLFCRLGASISQAPDEPPDEAPAQRHIRRDFPAAMYRGWGRSKPAVIKAVRVVAGCNLNTARNAIECINRTTRELALDVYDGDCISGEDINELCRAMDEAGAEFSA